MSGGYNSESLDSKITLLLERSERDQLERTLFRTEILNQLAGLTFRADATNGKIADCMRELDILKAEREANKRDIDQIIFIKKLITNRYFIIGIGLLSAAIIKFPIIGGMLSLLKGI